MLSCYGLPSDALKTAKISAKMSVLNEAKERLRVKKLREEERRNNVASQRQILEDISRRMIEGKIASKRLCADHEDTHVMDGIDNRSREQTKWRDLTKENVHRIQHYSDIRCKELEERIRKDIGCAALRRQDVIREKAQRASVDEKRLAALAQNRLRMEEFADSHREQMIDALSVKDLRAAEKNQLLQSNWSSVRKESNCRTALARARCEAMAERRSATVAARLHETGEQAMQRVIDRQLRSAEERDRRRTERYEQLKAAHLRNEVTRRRREEMIASRFEEAKEVGNIVSAFNRQYGIQH